MKSLHIIIRNCNRTTTHTILIKLYVSLSFSFYWEDIIYTSNKYNMFLIYYFKFFLKEIYQISFFNLF